MTKSSECLPLSARSCTGAPSPTSLTPPFSRWLHADLRGALAAAGIHVHGSWRIHGCRGLLFAGSALRERGLPRPAVSLFGAGLLVNLLLALVPAPGILQTVGTAVRNAGVVGMCYAILFDNHGEAA